MIKALRNTHRRAWQIIAILLPVGIFFSWLVIPDPIPVTILSAPDRALLPVIRDKRESAQYCVNIRSNPAKTAWQLEWKNKLPLTVPSAVIYQTENKRADLKKAQLIGRIEARGDYVFPLKMDPATNRELNLIIYDFIHEKVIDSLNLKI